MTNRIEELFKELTKEIDTEEENLGDTCPKHLDGLDCTRPRGHSGLHVAMGISGRIFLMWDEDLSDE